MPGVAVVAAVGGSVVGELSALAVAVAPVAVAEAPVVGEQLVVAVRTWRWRGHSWPSN